MNTSSVKYIAISHRDFEGEDVRYFASREELEQMLNNSNKPQDFIIYEVAGEVKLKWSIIEAKTSNGEKKGLKNIKVPEISRYQCLGCGHRITLYGGSTSSTYAICEKCGKWMSIRGNNDLPKIININSNAGNAAFDYKRREFNSSFNVDEKTGT